MTNFDSLANQAGQRSRGYWLLSRLFLEVPTAPMLADLRHILADHGQDPPAPDLAALRHAVADALAAPDEAAVAYTRHLSLGDKKAGEPLPYEAHVREGQLPGVATQQVAAVMLEAGYDDVAPGAPSADHLGAELRFMALLCLQEHQAWLNHDNRAATECLHRQRAFLDRHLGLWAPDYCLGLAGRTSNAYLRTIAQVAARTIRDDELLAAEICRWLAPDDLLADPSGQPARDMQTPTP